MGRAEIWLTAGDRLGDPTHFGRTREITAQVCSRADKSGHGFALAPGEPRFDPTLFRGMAGVGYSLLRLVEPAVLPSILLLG
jgi:lantibiotic modifying enzyme